MLGNTKFYSVQHNQLDISDLESGVYTLLIPSKNGIVSQKVVVE